MLCQNCKNANAEFHYKSTINGKTSELHLCAECAAKMAPKLNLDDTFSLNSYLGSLLPGFMGPFNTLPETRRCPLCGATARDIRRSGKVGCAQCYESFSELLLPYIQRIHGTARHSGKLPAAAGESLKRRREAESLQAELKQAVEAQEFEKAAELRDRLRALEAEE